MSGPLIINKEDQLILVGSLLAMSGATCAVIEKEKGRFESTYGYQIVNLILASKPEELYERLWLPAWRIAKVSPPSGLPAIQFDSECKRALDLIVANRFGDLMFLDDNGRPCGLLNLERIVRNFASKTKSIGIKLKEVSSELDLVTGRESVIEVFRFMMSNRVRRIVINRGGEFYTCTEREVLRALFSLTGLESMRDAPEKLLNSPFGALVAPFLSPVPNVDGSLDVAQGWGRAASSITTALIVDGKRIASPWDMVVKPFLAGKLPF